MLCIPDSERGSVLILLLLSTAVLQLLAAALMANALVESRIARQQELGLRLHYIAEAGLEQALAVKKIDFGFTGALAAVPCGEGSYSVVITPDPEEPQWKHRIESTGELDGKYLTLGVIVEQRELAGAVLLTDDLTVWGAVISGAVHCNHRLSILGAGNCLLDGAVPGELGHCCRPERLCWGSGGVITIGGNRYSEQNPLPGEWHRDPQPLPEINLEQLIARYHFTRKSGSKQWRTAPDYGKVRDQDGRERQYLHIEHGDLTICPDPGESFNFTGIIAADGNVSIGGSGTIELEGLIISGGSLTVTNGVNAAAGNRAVVLAAEGDLKVFGTPNDSTENPFFGGDLLLFSRGGAVTIGHQRMKGEQLVMHGIIFAKKIAVCNCNLTLLSGDGGSWSEYFPAYGMVVTEWLQP